jgi:LuxR family quorum-sensing transcriptional regulator LasR
MELLEALQPLLEARTQEVWTSRLFSIAGAYGFSHILYGVIPNRQCPLTSAVVISNYPATLCAVYARDDLRDIDPTVAHCFNKSVPIIWSGELFRTVEQKRLYEVTSHFGLRHGISYPIHGSRGEFGIMSFVSSERIDRHDRLLKSTLMSDLALIRDYAFESSIGLLLDISRPQKQVSLTPRELECLNWIADGKSSWETSKILGCAESTINFHILNINKKLAVRTRQQAIVKGIRLGLIAPR